MGTLGESVRRRGVGTPPGGRGSPVQGNEQRGMARAGGTRGAGGSGLCGWKAELGRGKPSPHRTVPRRDPASRRSTTGAPPPQGGARRPPPAPHCRGPKSPLRGLGKRKEKQTPRAPAGMPPPAHSAHLPWGGQLSFKRCLRAKLRRPG